MGLSWELEEQGAEGVDQGSVGSVGGWRCEGVVVEFEGAEGVTEIVVETVLVYEDIVGQDIAKFGYLVLIQTLLLFSSCQSVHLQQDLIVLSRELLGEDGGTFHHYIDQSLHLTLCQSFLSTTDIPSLLHLDILLPSDISIPLQPWIGHSFVVFGPGIGCIDKALLLQCLIKEINKYFHDLYIECYGVVFTGICVSLVVGTSLALRWVPFLAVLFLGWPASIFADFLGLLRGLAAGRNLPRLSKVR